MVLSKADLASEFTSVGDFYEVFKPGARLWSEVTYGGLLRVCLIEVVEMLDELFDESEVLGDGTMGVGIFEVFVVVLSLGNAVGSLGLAIAGFFSKLGEGVEVQFIDCGLFGCLVVFSL